jgi:hypothetical protein
MSLHVSNLVGSSSERQLCMQYCMFTCVGVSSLVGRVAALLTPMHVNILYCIHNCLSEDKPTRFETCRRHQKLNVNLETCAFRWSVSCNCITVHGAKKLKNNLLTFLQRDNSDKNYDSQIGKME